jgi:hypothetical protein
MVAGWDYLAPLQIAALSHEYLALIILSLLRLPFNAHITCRIASQITTKINKENYNKSHQRMAQRRKGIHEPTRNPRL